MDLLLNLNAHIESALKTLSFEKKGLELLFEAIRSDLAPAFIQAVDLIKSTKGRTIITGLGKSGHVGAKIAATLASTGTPAFFLHAAEANHGDLGMITKDDILIALSWSGSTTELSGILNHSVRFSIPLIALTSKKDSFLGKQADILLHLPQIEEACPHGLAPTTSTTIQMALGDALAVALLESRGFTANDFKVFHPGGSLGAHLKLIKEIMHKGDSLPIVESKTPMLEAMKVLSEKHFGCVAIVDYQGHLLGIITEGDLVRHLSCDLSKAKVDEIMTTDPKTIHPEMLVGKATSLIYQYQISALLVVENKKPVGIVHFHDLLRIGAL